MTEKDMSAPAGNTLFEAFVEQVKQVLEHLYDFAYLQQHPLARLYDRDGDFSAKTAGRQIRQEVITAIESLKPHSSAHFRAPTARLYNMLHLYYVENLTIQEAAGELGLSERQAYRDLRRGQESIAVVMWDKRLPDGSESLPTSNEPNFSERVSTVSAPIDFSFESEIARLKPDFTATDLGLLVQQSMVAVARLAQAHNVDLVLYPPDQACIVSTDSGIAHQVIISMLSYAVRHALPGEIAVTLKPDANGEMIHAAFSAHSLNDDTSAISKLAALIHWKITFDVTVYGSASITISTAPGKSTLLVVDDNQGWIELVGRFLAGYDCNVVSPTENQDVVQQATDLIPSAILLDVMMPKRDGWEILQRLRAQPATVAIPVIVCSVFNDPQLAYSLGASAFVAKPASRETILETLENLRVI